MRQENINRPTTEMHYAMAAQRAAPFVEKAPEPIGPVRVVWDSSTFDTYDYADCPYANLRDAQGDEYLCQIGLLDDPRVPQQKACVALDEWTSKLT